MTTPTKTAIAQALEVYLTSHTMSANEFVKKFSINESYVSNIRSGANRIGDTEIAPRWFEKIAEAIGYKLTKNYWTTVMTNQTTAMLAYLQDAKAFGETNIIIGETGCGKSYTASLFETANPNHTYIVKVSSSDNLSDLIDKILTICKLPSAKTKSKNIIEIVRFLQKLKFDGKNPMIVFDECEYMKQPTLSMMKELHDDLKKHCAIILIGTDELQDNLDKLRKRKKAGMRQFYRRMKFGIRVLPSIDTSFKQFLNGIEDSGLKKFLQRACENYGELHDVLVPAFRESDRTGEPLTEGFVRKVLNIPTTMFK